MELTHKGEKKVHKKRFSLSKELKLVPQYLILSAWVGFTFVLIMWVLAASLSTTSDIFNGGIFKFSSGLHFENYSRAWFTANVSTFFLNSLLYAVVCSSALILICAPYSYVLQRFQFKGRNTLKSLLSASTGVPIIMIIIPLYMMVAKAGLLQNPVTNRLVLIFLFIATKVPYTTIFLMSSFENISRTYEEAAAIDGSSPSRTFWQIILPLVQGGIVTVTIFNFINIWNEYFLSLLFVNSDSLRPVALGLVSMINGMQYSGDWSGLFASVIIVLLPTFLIYVVLSRKIIGSMLGGIKG